MFFGQYEQNVESKGRVFVPSVFREQIKEQKLYLYQKNEKKIEVFLTAEGFSEESFPFVFTATLDKQGRILIPAFFRDSFKKKARFTGYKEYFTIEPC